MQNGKCDAATKLLAVGPSLAESGCWLRVRQTYPGPSDGNNDQRFKYITRVAVVIMGCLELTVNIKYIGRDVAPRVRVI